MAAVVKPHGLGVKASAGIRDKEKALAMVKAGADRLGTKLGCCNCFIIAIRM